MSPDPIIHSFDSGPEELSQHNKFYFMASNIHIFIAWATDQPKTSFKSLKSIENHQKGKAEILAFGMCWAFITALFIRVFEKLGVTRPHSGIVVSLIFLLGLWSWWFSEHIDKKLSKRIRKKLDNFSKYSKWSLSLSVIFGIPIIFYFSIYLLKPS